MPKNIVLMLLIAGSGLTAACGDKLDPVTEEAPDVTTGTGTTATDSNTPTTSSTGNTNSTTGTGTTTGGTTTGGTTTGGTTTGGTTTGGTTTGVTTTGGTTTALCGTTATSISYATHIAPLVSSYCSSCHGSGGTSPTMTTFSNTKSGFVNFDAQDQIDSKAMPQGRSLSANQICLFDAWVTGNYAP